MNRLKYDPASEENHIRFAMGPCHSFLEVFRPFVTFSHFLGINQYSLSYSPNGEIALKRSSRIAAGLDAIVYILICSLQIISPMAELGYPPLAIIATQFSIVIGFYVKFVDSRNRSKYACIIRGFHRIDDSVAILIFRKIWGNSDSVRFGFSWIAWEHCHFTIVNGIRSPAPCMCLLDVWQSMPSSW